MKKKLLALMVIIACLSQIFAINVYAFPEFPDIGGMLSDAAEGISNAAKDAKDVITDKTEEAGKVITDTADKVGDFVSEKAKDLGGKASEAATQVANIASGFASDAGALFSDWGKQAGKTADNVKRNLADAGVTIKVKAGDLGNATRDKASELAESAGDTFDDAIGAVSGAANLVVDEAGHVVDLASVGMDYVTDGANAALEILKEKGSYLMEVAEDALAGIDLNDKNNWDEAQILVEKAIGEVCEDGMLGKHVDNETIHIVSTIVFSALMNGYQYSEGQITLGEYAGAMSKVIIREGLPTGVGFVVDLLPIPKIPYASEMAKEATIYLISVAYGDKDGDEIVAEEAGFFSEGLEQLESIAEEEAEE